MYNVIKVYGNNVIVYWDLLIFIMLVEDIYD